MCQGWTDGVQRSRVIIGLYSGGQRCRIINKGYTPEQSNILRWRGILLSNSIKKALADRQGHWSGEQLVEQLWLQLMCCTLVSSCEVGHIFWSDGSHQDRGPKRASEGVGVDKIRLGLVDINLQTEEIHYNYSVLIGSLE